MIKELAIRAKKMTEPVLREGATALDKAKYKVLSNKAVKPRIYLKKKNNLLKKAKIAGILGGAGYLGLKSKEAVDENELKEKEEQKLYGARY